MDSSVFKMNRSHPGFDLISGCVLAVRRGDTSGLTRECFEKALTKAAEAYATESGRDFHASYAAILDTEIGRELFNGYNAAPPAERPEPVVKSDPGPDSWRQIEKAADELKRETGHQLTKEQAVSRILKERPELYSAYIEEVTPPEAA